MLAQLERDFGGRAQQPLQLAERLGRHQHLLALAQHARTRQVAHRQPVGVRRHQPQPALLGGHQHTRQHRPCVIGARRSHDLAQCFGEVVGLERDRLTRSVRQPRELTRRVHAHLALELARRDPRFVLVGLHDDGARLELADDLGREPRGNDTDAVPLARHGDLDLDRQVVVGARDTQPVAGHLDAQTGQHREQTTTARNGAAGSAKRLDEDITFAAEFHRALPSLKRFISQH